MDNRDTRIHDNSSTYRASNFSVTVIAIAIGAILAVFAVNLFVFFVS